MSKVNSNIDEAKLSYDSVITQTGFLQGKVLTVIDASYSDVIQRKAVKDLLREIFRDQCEWMYQISHQPSGSGTQTPPIPNPLLIDNN